MNFKKFSKTTILLIASLLATSSVFAAGIKEVSKDSTLAIIENIEEKDYSYNFQVLTDSDELIISLDKKMTESILSLPSYRIGDYIEIKGLEKGDTISKAKSVRFISPLVLSGAVHFEPTNPEIIIPEADYGFNNDLNISVNYSYGALVESSFESQGLFINSSYFLRGMQDAVKLEEDSMFTVQELNQFLQDYQAAVQQDNTILPKDFGTSLTIEEIKALPKAEKLEDKFAYSYGFMFAANFLTTGFPLDVDYFSNGFLTAASKGEFEISNYQMQNAIRDFEAKFTAEQEAKLNELKSKNLNSANAFLEINKKAKDVIVTESGLQYKILKEAEGAKPVADDTVLIDYELTLPNGQVIDSSFERGTPATLPLNGVIPGFREAVTNMTVGSSIIAWIPPAIGYGEAGNNGIEPNMLLTFRIDLIEITKVEETK